jgi:hypothetical protein
MPHPSAFLILCAAALALSSCAAGERGGAGTDMLAAELAGRSAGAERECVPRITGEALRVVDARTLVYGRGGTVYVNRLARPCPGLTAHSQLIVEADAGHYCRNTRIRPVEPGSAIPGPVCLLGRWTPYAAR